MRDHFSGYHPLVQFLYFALVLLFTMCLTHPISALISLTVATGYARYLNGGKRMCATLLYLLPVMVLAAIINAAFNHAGATILAYLPSGNPLTLESILCGLGSALILGAVIVWFSCYSAVMTSDKFIYLFGRIIPSFSLILSMTLRFIPKFRAQLRLIIDGQRCLGRDISSGKMIPRLKTSITILSILLTWSLENAIETADSMKSRGYGLEGRTAFSIYTFTERDRNALIWLGFCGSYIAAGWAVGGLNWRYFPTMLGAPIAPLTLSFQLIYLALCLTPLILNRKEDAPWKYTTAQK